MKNAMRGLVLVLLRKSFATSAARTCSIKVLIWSGEGTGARFNTIVIIDARLSKARIPRPSIRLCLAESEITSRVSSYFGLIDH